MVYDGWVDEGLRWMDGWTKVYDGWMGRRRFTMDGWMDGRMNGRTEQQHKKKERKERY